jgi:hypothetical protein
MTPPIADEALLRAQAFAKRTLTAEEIAASAAVPVSDEERAEILDLVRWFCGRYPAPAERLAYVRRAYARWTQR